MLLFAFVFENRGFVLGEYLFGEANIKFGKQILNLGNKY